MANLNRKNTRANKHVPHIKAWQAWDMVFGDTTHDMEDQERDIQQYISERVHCMNKEVE